MSIHPDFEKLLRLLEEHGVEYMIVGGYAVAYHGYPRFTKDLDVFFNPTATNIERLRKSLTGFGFSEDDLPLEAFSTAGNVLTFGVVPTRVDLINDIDGITYEKARRNIVRGTYGTVEVSFIGFDDLLRNKKATPRAKDKGDLEELLSDGDE
ncbi:MAG: nucleotidyltransferase [Polyangia bacterium]